MKNSSNTSKQRTSRAFGRAAVNYDANAVLQREVAVRMDERLDFILHKPKLILDAGSGTGFAASLLAKRYPKAIICELDLSPGMLQTAQQKSSCETAENRKIWRICGDMVNLPIANSSVDLIWSNLALQWIAEPKLAFAEFNRILKPNGLLMFSTLGPDTLFELSAAFKASEISSSVNKFIDMHNLGDALLDAGLGEPVMDMEKIILSYPNFSAILHDLKAAGSHCNTSPASNSLHGKNAYQRLGANYERWREAGKLPATYEIIYGHAWCKTNEQAKQIQPQVINFYTKPTEQY